MTKQLQAALNKGLIALAILASLLSILTMGAGELTASVICTTILIVSLLGAMALER